MHAVCMNYSSKVLEDVPKACIAYHAQIANVRVACTSQTSVIVHVINLAQDCYLATSVFAVLAGLLSAAAAPRWQGYNDAQLLLARSAGPSSP